MWEKVKEVLVSGDIKTQDEWLQIVNSNLPKKHRMSLRSFAHKIKELPEIGIDYTKDNGMIQFTTSPSSGFLGQSVLR